MKIFTLLIFVSSSFFITQKAKADCTLAPTAVCNGASCAGETRPEGHVLYNRDFQVPQACHNGSWKALTTIGCPDGDGCVDPCAVSPSPGAVCNDGTVYAGLSLDGNVPMFTTPCDAGMSWDGSGCTGTRFNIPWNNWNSTGYVTTNVTNDYTGEANTNTLVSLDSDSATAGVQPHDAAQFCFDMNSHGHADWYLPAPAEITLFYSNRGAIGGFNPTGIYWTSREGNNVNARALRFADGGAINASGKRQGRHVRCARRN